MKTQSPKPKKAKVKKFYTYSVSVSFDMQYTFGEDEIQQAEEGGKNDFDPTDKALADLESELKEYLSQNYCIRSIEAFTDFDSLLGISD
jgi:hypothetical protein